MRYEKYSFIGKIDKISDDFNTYFDQLDAMKNLEKDSGELLNPEFYLQSIINRKRPETAVPCSFRNNRNNSFDQEKKLNKQTRIKTSTLNRFTATPVDAEFDKCLMYQDIHNNNNENDNIDVNLNEKNNYFNNYDNEDNLFPGCYQQEENDNELNENINNRAGIHSQMSQTKNKANNNEKNDIDIDDIFSFGDMKQKIGKFYINKNKFIFKVSFQVIKNLMKF